MAVVPCLLYVDRRMPIASDAWVNRLLFHIPLSVAFSAIHISAMMGIRKGVIAMLGGHYDPGSIAWVFVYEYRKDLVVYVLAMAAIYAYREIIRLRQGEAQMAQPASGEDDNRILVSKRGLFHFIEPTSIDWVEAAGNYVELHVGDETYMLRGTMKEIETRLGTEAYARIHRSTIVNRQRIKKIVPAMNGDKIVILDNKSEFRFSRRYRQASGLNTAASGSPL